MLELACGPGGVGIAAAELVAPGGEVVLSDVAAEMTAIAAARAAAAGAVNVQARVLDLESIDEPDASYDVVLCREGLMFAPDPARAASEIRRVLRPGGRVAIAVWGPRERNPWLGLVFDAVSAQTGAPVPPPGVPGPFSLGDSRRLVGAARRDAGLADVQISELPTPLRAGIVRGVVGADVGARRAAGQDPRGAPRAGRARRCASACARRSRPYTTATGVEIPGRHADRIGAPASLIQPRSVRASSRQPACAANASTSVCSGRQ